MHKVNDYITRCMILPGRRKDDTSETLNTQCTWTIGPCFRDLLCAGSITFYDENLLFHAEVAIPQGLACSASPSSAIRTVAPRNSSCIFEISPSMPPSVSDVILRASFGDLSAHAPLRVWHLAEIAVKQAWLQEHPTQTLGRIKGFSTCTHIDDECAQPLQTISTEALPRELHALKLRVGIEQINRAD
jgi:hypothetical protein